MYGESLNKSLHPYQLYVYAKKCLEKIEALLLKNHSIKLTKRYSLELSKFKICIGFF